MHGFKYRCQRILSEDVNFGQNHFFQNSATLTLMVFFFFPHTATYVHVGGCNIAYDKTEKVEPALSCFYTITWIVKKSKLQDS